jgi:chitin-binding protein
VTRRIVRRTAGLAAAGAFAALAGLVPALPALAHGAPVQPISRTAACAPGNADARSAACTAARAANGQAFGAFDNLRVPGVDGRDKQVIPDGRLCSGGLPAFKGLDLPRDDWPATRVTAGGRLTVQYRATIPHRGSFRIYLTRPGYDPTEPLGWDDLSSKPILTADDPPLRDGSYRMTGRLPADRTGRHLLYTVWQTSSTPDTYYSCSDLIIKAPAGAATATKPRSAQAPRSATSAEPLAGRSSGPAAVAGAGPATGAEASAARPSWMSRAADDERMTLGRQITGTVLIVVVGITGSLAVVRIRRARADARTTDRRPDRR